ncbi:MAG: 5-methyltetrahydropteroyltriglutamate--homocysteine S-methyltransferase [Alphaproteobacteria bacterium]
MVKATNLGFPRIGAKREVKKVLEGYWGGKLTAAELSETATRVRALSWRLQADLGIGHIPSNDFSLYDQVLDTAAMVGAVPERFGWSGEAINLDRLFAMARGSKDATAMEMTKWFDTNYHYIVPEFGAGQRFCLSSTKPVDEFLEAKALAIHTRPVLVGPITFLLLGKPKEDSFAPISLLDRLLPVYGQVLSRLADAGADWVQIDEPVLATDLDAGVREAFAGAYRCLADAAPGLKLLVATYFGGLRENLPIALTLPVAALHLDLVRAPGELAAALEAAPASLALSLGAIDGRNVWRADLGKALGLVETAVEKLGAERVLVGPSCSLLHVPVDLDAETGLDNELKGWLAFAKQKLGEVVALAQGTTKGREFVAEALAASDTAAAARKASTRTHNPAVKKRVAEVDASMLRRRSPFAERRSVQRATLDLPDFPTTTIGSFPQTQDVRKARAELTRRQSEVTSYERFLKGEIEKAVRFQEEIGLDVLVHGEFERNDMVQYFGEQLDGFAVSQNGWVQSYGSRYVKPPIIFGDVSRPAPMTVQWIEYAQALTDRPMKGMLTGPVTILRWSFVRDDQPRLETCKQIAVALRDEVLDLEAAGIKIVQIDEPAFREGLPLRKSDWNSYLDWAVDCFRLASCGVKDETQVHSHMCYSEFNDIIRSIAEMDADVISIEASRSQMELLSAFTDYKYPNEIGPGVYDIHSPRIPAEDEVERLLRRAVEVFDPGQVWVNPDCGLKTRGWAEVKPALQHMVNAARRLR